tara:strand:+ start:14793 stop:15218 length:426 start_codon:yes stop_codon:yes gene_type:complete
MRSYCFLDNIAIADIAFEARGETPEELLLAAADALIATIANPCSVRPRQEHVLQLTSCDLSELLFAWLSELVFLKDAEAMVFCDTDVTVREKSYWELSARIRGDSVQNTQQLGSDVKAITKHMYDVSHNGSEWVAIVVLDI